MFFDCAWPTRSTQKTKLKMRASLLYLTLLLAIQLSNASNLRQAAGRRLNPRELEEGATIFALYRGQHGHKTARQCARTVIQDNDDDDIIILKGNGYCMDQIQRDPDIIEADFDYQIHILGSGGFYAPNPEGIVPWELSMIGAEDLDTGSHDIVICIVDSGIALDHPDFDENVVSGDDSETFYRDAWKWDEDRVGHGTAVAGILAAIQGHGVAVNGTGRFRLHITRSVDNDGVGYEHDMQNAIDKCVEAGAHIINLSLGGPYMSSGSRILLTEIVEEQGILVIAAAGNDGSDLVIYPASFPSVISVSAVYEFGTRCEFSNYGAQVEFAAPGYEVTTTSVSSHSVRHDDVAFPASNINRANDESVTGELKFCDSADDECKSVNGKICLMVHDNISLHDLIQKCEGGDGIGAIIFSSTAGRAHENWVVNNANIPAVAVSKTVGQTLVNDYVKQSVTIGDAEGDGIEYAHETKSGTSLAAPYVAVAAALVWSHFGDRCSNHQIRYALASTAREAADQHDEGCNDRYGYGIVNAKRAYEYLIDNDCSIWDVPQFSQGGCSTVV